HRRSFIFFPAPYLPLACSYGGRLPFDFRCERLFRCILRYHRCQHRRPHRAPTPSLESRASLAHYPSDLQLMNVETAVHTKSTNTPNTARSQRTLLTTVHAFTHLFQIKFQSFHSLSKLLCLQLLLIQCVFRFSERGTFPLKFCNSFMKILSLAS